MPKMFELNPRALELWNPSLQAADADDEASISLTGIVGDEWPYDDYAKPFTLARVDAALRAIGDKRVTVYINSPGGSIFEGISIMNRLNQHKAGVTIKVLGLAGSAASVIAMAGDRREIGKTAFLFLHNCWSILAGNRHELRQTAGTLEEFDYAMRDLYAEKSGQDESTAEGWMDADSYFSGKTAVELGLMTHLLNDDEVSVNAQAAAQDTPAARRIEAALIKTGMPRSERRKLLSEYKAALLPSQQAPTQQPEPEPQSDAADQYASSQQQTLEAVLALRGALTAK